MQATLLRGRAGGRANVNDEVGRGGVSKLVMIYIRHARLVVVHYTCTLFGRGVGRPAPGRHGWEVVHRGVERERARMVLQGRRDESALLVVRGDLRVVLTVRCPVRGRVTR